MCLNAILAPGYMLLVFILAIMDRNMPLALAGHVAFVW
jgi:hypothetical protein